MSEKAPVEGLLWAQVQMHRLPKMGNTSTVIEADHPHAVRAEEQGIVFKQNVAVMRDTFREDIAPPSLDMAPRVEPLSALPKVDLPQVEMLFSPYVAQWLMELSDDLWGKLTAMILAFWKTKVSGQVNYCINQRLGCMPTGSAKVCLVLQPRALTPLRACELRSKTRSRCLC